MKPPERTSKRRRRRKRARESEEERTTPGESKSSTPLLTTNLSLGTRSDEVKLLQDILIKKGHLKQGLNTGYFGTQTQAALKKYQCAQNITCGGTNHGRVDIATRLKLNLESDTTTTSSTYTFTRTLSLGTFGSDVKELQKFLNTQGFIVKATGGGSPGNETTFYGPATARAVSRFQEAHRTDILTPTNLTRGNGRFGPRTLQKANTLMGTTATTTLVTDTRTLVERMLELIRLFSR